MGPLTPKTGNQAAVTRREAAGLQARRQTVGGSRSTWLREATVGVPPEGKASPRGHVGPC